MMEKRMIYHGSRKLIEVPEIRISQFNKDFYYQSHGYIAACYRIGEVLDE